jgi:hypothetical protein
MASVVSSLPNKQVGGKLRGGKLAVEPDLSLFSLQNL